MLFSELNLLPEILRAVEEIGFTEATDIQIGAIPLFLEGKDLIGRSSTGTGKTAAFGIPVVQMVSQSDGAKGQVLILSPTRELAAQTADEIHKFSKYLSKVGIATVCGGQPMVGQIHQLRTAQIIIGTPGRIMDHMRRGTLTLNNLKSVILDEADEMLNMGFLEDIQTILTEAPETRQTALFSATMPSAIMQITKQFQTDPKIVAVDKGQKTVDNISQFYYNVPQANKNDALKLLLEYHHPKRALIFCNTKKMVDELCGVLNDSGFQSIGLHGDLKQSQRDQVMRDFKNGRNSILIATDVAARGIDVDDVEAVFNYDVPQENEYYIHRIGRTGRAGKTGASYTLAANRTQLTKVHTLERFMGAKIEEASIPSLEDIHVRHLKKFSVSIKLMVDENSGSEWIPFIEELEKDGYQPKDIAAALCAKIDSKNKRLSAVKNIRKMDAIPVGNGRTWLNMDIGTADKVDANFILGAIIEATGLSSKAIGKIYIFKDYANIEMTPEDANMVIRKMANSKIMQRTVHFTIASKTRQEACERTYKERKYSAGPHRQRSYSNSPRGAKPAYPRHNDK
jgi:ATP-dependent RNA helicase DeaD